MCLAQFYWALAELPYAWEPSAGWWVVWVLVINVFFLVDIILQISVYGFIWVMKKKVEYILEAVIQIVACVCVIMYWVNPTFVKATSTVDTLCILMLLRNLRIVHLLTEIKDFDLIIETFKKFASPMIHMLFTMYTVASFFCVLGMLVFRSGLTVPKMADLVGGDAPFLYYLENFNDFYSGMVTLFCVMIENNWNNTTDMFTDVFGNWARVYFCSYWVCMVLIMWNIVASMIMELYSTTSESLQDRYEKQRLVQQLSKSFKNKEELEEFVK